MTIIEIAPLDNGAHRNQTASRVLEPPFGWAAVPEEMLPLKNYPFGTVDAEEINGIMTVTQWTPGTIPDPEPDPGPVPTPQEDTDAMIIDHELRITMLELGLTDGEGVM